MFGDGCLVEFHNSKNFTNRDGVKMLRFILRPTSKVRALYDIEDDLDEFGYAIREYPEVHVIPLDRDNFSSRLIVELDFQGGYTILSNRHIELTSALMDAEKRARAFEAAKNRAYDDLRVEGEHQARALKLAVDKVREAQRGRGRSDGDVGDAMESGGGQTP